MVSNAVLIGDKRKFLSCLLTLRVVMDPDTLRPTDKLDANCLLAMQAIGSSATTVAEAKADPKLAKAVQEGIDRANAAAASRAQKVQKFVVLDTELSVPGGELTLRHAEAQARRRRQKVLRRDRVDVLKARPAEAESGS